MSNHFSTPADHAIYGAPQHVRTDSTAEQAERKLYGGDADDADSVGDERSCYRFCVHYVPEVDEGAGGVDADAGADAPTAAP